MFGLQLVSIFARRGTRRKTKPTVRRHRSRLALEELEARDLRAAFIQTNLVSDIAGLAAFTDPQLINPWGLTASGNSPFWVSDNQNGLSTLYNGQGMKGGLVVGIPSAANSPFTHPTPTGTVFNTDPNAGDFKVTAAGTNAASIFLFDTLDGTISGWNGTGTNAVIAPVTNPGAIYTGLAIDTTAANTQLYAADWGKGTVDVFNGTFQQIDQGAFQDAAIPNTFRPFNVQDINGNIFVTYAQFDANTGADTGTGGFVAEYNRDGVLQMTITGNGQFNSPWGVALAPAGYGALGGDLLVGNFGDGHINAFNLGTGQFVAALTDTAGNPIAITNLWAIRFGNGGAAGSPNTLFFTAGLTDAPATIFGATDGLLGSLQPATANQNFVAQLYLDLLHRPVDSGGLAGWTRALDQGMSRMQVVLGIEGSTEFLSGEVKGLYQQYLHRTADAGGLAAFTDFLAHGGTVEQAAARIAGSTEYFQVRGGGTNNGFLAALYQDALNRNIDPSGQASFGMILANGASRQQVAADILSSPEFFQDTVKGFYLNLLHRAADAGGLNGFANALAGGATDQQVIAAIAASDEFFAKL
jgi:uncharacterized protein (TIGR03118 family)